MALGLKHGGAPEPHWPGPTPPPERRVRPPALSWSGGAGTPPQRAIVGLKGSVKHPASGSLGKTWCFLRSHTICFEMVITRVVIACRIPALQTSSFRSTGSHGFLCLSRVPDKTWWVLVTLRVFAEPVNEPNGQELVLLRALNPRLASALTEGCSVTVFLLLLVLPQKALRGSQHPPPSPQNRPSPPPMGSHCSNLKCDRIKCACVKLQTSGPTCSLQLVFLSASSPFPLRSTPELRLNGPVWLHSVLWWSTAAHGPVLVLMDVGRPAWSHHQAARMNTLTGIRPRLCAFPRGGPRGAEALSRRFVCFHV